MKPTPFILDQNKSITDVIQFLNFTNSKSRIRARDLQDGRIELYVRDNSFKQFFTDKLRLRSHVKQDYNAARNRVWDMIKKADPDGENSCALMSIKKSLASNKHDFLTDSFAGSLKAALYPQDEISAITDLLTSGQAQVNLSENIEGIRDIDSSPAMTKIGLFLLIDEVEAEIQEVCDRIENVGDKNEFLRNHKALKSITARPSTASGSLGPDIMDYKCAIDFFRVWLRETRNQNTGRENRGDATLSNEIRNKLSRIAEHIERNGVPLGIDLNGGKLENSDADLIIFDNNRGFTPFLNPAEDTNDHLIVEKPVSLKSDPDNFIFKTNTFQEKRVSEARDLTAGFAIFYGIDVKFDEPFKDAAYAEIEKTISEKMTQKLASSSKLTTENNSAGGIYTIHLPVMNPFYGQNLKPAEKN